MARTRKSTPAPEPTPEDIQATAEEQAAGDAALLASLQERDGPIQFPTPEPPKGPTIADNFITSAALLAQAKRSYRLNEATLIKLYELNLMWALNNRQQGASQDIYRDDDLVQPEEGVEGPGEDEVNEVIRAVPHQVAPVDED